MSALSLFAAIFFCIPGMGFVAAILGVIALYRIGNAGGRLGGRTFAAVGLTIGLISTAGWLSLGLGARQFYATYTRSMAAPMVEYFRHLERGEVTAASAIFETKAVPSATEFGVFRSGLREILGDAKGPVDFADAKIMWGMRSTSLAVDSTRQYVGGPLKFDKGIAMVLFRLTPGTPATAYFPASGVDQITVTLPSGQVLRLPEAPPQIAPETTPRRPDTVEAPR